MVDEEQVTIPDFPKIETPFEREVFQVDPEDFKQYKHEYGLRQPEVYLVVNKVKTGYEWVFNDPDTIAVEKLNGTNVGVRVDNGRITVIQNRENPIDPMTQGLTPHVEGVLRAFRQNKVTSDGVEYGEVVGPELQDKRYGLNHHIWYPFYRAVDSLRYKSFHNHERTFANWSFWFRYGLFSLFYRRMHQNRPAEERPADIPAEGVVFYNFARKQQGEDIWCAKLRRDLFAWYYDPVCIHDLPPEQQYEPDNETMRLQPTDKEN